MRRTTTQVFAGFVLLVLAILCSYIQRPTIAQTRTAQSTMGVKKTAGRKFGNAIAQAMSAGPMVIARHATIIGCAQGSCADMNELAKGPVKELRAGTNGWVCYPLRDGPMCLDKEWQKWMQAWISKSAPNIEGTGIGYMLRGDTGSSNTDPFAMSPTANNVWVIAPPHIMVLYEDPKLLEPYPTDPKAVARG